MIDLQPILPLLKSGFTSLKILVAGDLMLDRYIVGEVDRISPEAPVPILRPTQRYERPGGAANVAMNLAGLGCQTVLCGLWGADSEQAELLRLLTAAHIDTSRCVSGSRPTISKTRIIALRQQLLRLDIESLTPIPPEEATRLEARILDLLPDVHAVILADYNKGALSSHLCATIIRAARTADIPILVDPKSPDLSKYSGATVICPNLRELSLATAVPLDDLDPLLTAARIQMQEHDLQYIAVTLGDKGIHLLGPGDDFHSPAQPREVFDISGASDTVIAVIAAALAASLPIHTAVDLANPGRRNRHKQTRHHPYLLHRPHRRARQPRRKSSCLNV